MHHPFDRIGQRHLALATVGLVVAFGLLTAILIASVPIQDFARIREFVQARPSAAAREVLADWPPSTFQAFSFMLGFDLLYDVIHNNGVAIFSVWGAKRAATAYAVVAASLTAWVMWLDTVLNVFENLTFFHIIQTLEPAPLLPVAAAVFSFRSYTLVAGVLIGIALHTRAFWRSGESAA